jgi:hypothetical protein
VKAWFRQAPNLDVKNHAIKVYMSMEVKIHVFSNQE